MKIQPDQAQRAGAAKAPVRSEGKPGKAFGDLMREKMRPKGADLAGGLPGTPPASPLLREPGAAPVEMAAPESAPVRQVPAVVQALCTWGLTHARTRAVADETAAMAPV